MSDLRGIAVVRDGDGHATAVCPSEQVVSYSFIHSFRSARNDKESVMFKLIHIRNYLFEV